MLALITGGSGFVSSFLMAHLAEQGIASASFDIKEGYDLRDYNQVRVAIERVLPDHIYHLGATAYVPESTLDPRRGIDTNIIGTLNLLEAVRNSGSQAKILLAGTSESPGYSHEGILDEEVTCKPSSVYGITKLAAEQLGLTYAKTMQNSIVCTRAFNHTGPSHPAIYAVPSFAKRVAEVEAGKSRAVVHGNLNVRRSIADVRDIVRAYRLAIDLPSGVYNVCADNTVTMQYVLDTLCELAEVDIPTEVSDALYREASSQFPIPSCEKLKKATGWEPEIPFRQTLQDVLDYYRRNL